MHLRPVSGRRPAALLLVLSVASPAALAADATWRAAPLLPPDLYLPAPLLGSRPAPLPEDECETPAAMTQWRVGASAASFAGAAVVPPAAAAALAVSAAPATATVPVTAPATVPPPASWQLRASDRTLNGALARWAASAGWQLVWEVPADYAVESDTSINGTFEQAVDMVAASMATAEVPMKAIFYQGNHVLRMVAKGTP